MHVFPLYPAESLFFQNIEFTDKMPHTVTTSDQNKTTIEISIFLRQSLTYQAGNRTGQIRSRELTPGWERPAIDFCRHKTPTSVRFVDEQKELIQKIHSVSCHISRVVVAGTRRAMLPSHQIPEDPIHFLACSSKSLALFAVRAVLTEPYNLRLLHHFCTPLCVF